MLLHIPSGRHRGLQSRLGAQSAPARTAPRGRAAWPAAWRWGYGIVNTPATAKGRCIWASTRCVEEGNPDRSGVSISRARRIYLRFGPVRLSDFDFAYRVSKAAHLPSKIPRGREVRAEDSGALLGDRDGAALGAFCRPLPSKLRGHSAEHPLYPQLAGRQTTRPNLPTLPETEVEPRKRGERSG